MAPTPHKSPPPPVSLQKQRLTAEKIKIKRGDRELAFKIVVFAVKKGLQ